MSSAFAQHRTFTDPIYLVMFDFGHLGFEGTAYPERSKRNIIEELASGQLNRVVAVLEVFEGRSTDITDDIRNAVEQRALEAA